VSLLPPRASPLLASTAEHPSPHNGSPGEQHTPEPHLQEHHHGTPTVADSPQCQLWNRARIPPRNHDRIRQLIGPGLGARMSGVNTCPKSQTDSLGRVGLSNETTPPILREFRPPSFQHEREILLRRVRVRIRNRHLGGVCLESADCQLLATRVPE
jgi:hypothetical protein